MFKKKYKSLDIKGTTLDTNQFKDYMEKIASDHIVTNNSSKNTYPIYDLKQNYLFIQETYNLLNNHIKMKINIHPAGEWILDNFYIIEENVKILIKELTLKKYVNLVGLQTDAYKGFARVYILASEIIAYSGSNIDADNLEILLKAYQNKKTLTMDEIWNIELFLQIAIVKNIKELCEKIYLTQMQKYKVENILERLLEKKENSNQRFNKNFKYKAKDLHYKDLKYPFIEYMSYKLKKFGKEAYSFLNVLEEEVNKTGMTVEEAINKEHFSVAISKVFMRNSIESMKTISRINFVEIFERINGVEEILKNDPADVYRYMDFKSKNIYREKIKNISKITKISEIYIAKQVYNISLLAKDEYEKTKNELLLKKTHIGYYLIGEGIEELNLKVNNRFRKQVKQKTKADIYISLFFIIPIIISILIGFNIYTSINNLIMSILFIAIVYFPITEIYAQIVNYILSKIVKNKLIPKIDLLNGIPKEYSTIVIIPTIINSKEKVKEIISKLEVYYLANKSENIYFTLLGDCTSGEKENEEEDREIIETGINEIEKLNKKYYDSNFPKFSFLYRKRVWNSSQGKYLGWERKRGIITEFNSFLMGEIDNTFKYNSIYEWMQKENNIIPNIKFIITLDSDTNLILNSAFELIGAMAHILNKPIIKDGIVTSGYGIIQPRIGIDLVSAKKTIFTEIFAENGGVDPYTNAISDIYQDNFEEGIFTGKGIYDLKTFHTVLKNQIPENTVLSHDLLEGNYLKCGLASDILLMDGYPAKYNSFISRQHRWIRGDFQIVQWLKNKIKNKNGENIINPLNRLSKFKILDNLRRGLTPIFILFLFIALLFIKQKTILIGAISLLAIFISFILNIINYIIFKSDKIPKQKKFTSNIEGNKLNFIRCFLEFIFLPYKAYISFDAIVRTIYRNIKKQNLLEWTTAEEAEKKAKTNITEYYKQMWINIVLGLVFLFLSINILYMIIGAIWLFAPLVAWKISKDKKQANILKTINKEDKAYLEKISKNTWLFFENYLTKENNYLITDNYQESRINKIVDRTSSTNIGLSFLAIISAYDFKFISKEKAIELIENIVLTIKKLPKWNGHLYNWYNIKTLEPLTPKYISTVDSGNFLGYLYTLRQFLINLNCSEQLIEFVNEIIYNTDFSSLYNKKYGLFSIGFNIEENKLTDSYYDFLASEARQASIIAIAKKDVEHKHWHNLNRNLTIKNKYKGLISWSGTSFEYLMPNIVIQKYLGSLLDESCKFMIMNQKEYAKKLGIPWGISESAYNLKDLNYNYQYKAFGIPWLGLKRGLSDDLVVSAYGSILAIEDYPKDVIENIKQLENEGALGKYGFYEAVDYTPSRLNRNEKSAIVKTFLAHHQALILISINNLLNEGIIKKRFFSNAEIQAIDILLQERMPKDVIITKEKKEKIEKLKYMDYEDNAEKEYTKLNEYIININNIANKNYSIFMTDRGLGYSKYKDILINRYKDNCIENQGIFFYIKNIKTKKIWTNIKEKYNQKEPYSIIFSDSENKIKRQDENIITTTKITVAPDENFEIRSLELKNIGNTEEILEVTGFFEPLLSSQEDDNAHQAFNNLFLKYEYDRENESLIITRNERNKNRCRRYLGVNLNSDTELIGELEYEIDKEKFMGREMENIPKMIKESKPFTKSIDLVVDPVVAMRRTIKILPGQKIQLYFNIAISEQKEEVKEILLKYKNSEISKKIFEISKARIEAQNRYLGLKSKEICLYRKILSYLFVNNQIKQSNNKKFMQNELWKYGISGDLPIIFIKIKDVNNLYTIEEILKAYEFFRIKNISIDIVILNEEENIYEQYVKEAIENAMLNKYLMYLKNVYGGIYILNAKEMNEEDIELLNLRANLILDTKFGDIFTIMKEIEEEKIESIKEIGTDSVIAIENNEEVKNVVEEQIDQKQYYNEFGYFSEDGKEYNIKINKENRLPTVWSHVIANENFGTVVTENMGGFTWKNNSRLNRLTAWNNNPRQDIPSEIIYLKDMENGKYWSLGNNPAPDENEYYITYGFGYAKYLHKSDEILQELEVFVPRNDSVKVNVLRLKNIENKSKNLKLIYYINPVLGENKIETDKYLNTIKKGKNMIACTKQYNDILDEILYLYSSEPINSFTGNNTFFIGKGSLKYPDAINKIQLNNENSFGKKACVAIQIEIKLEPYESKEISLLLGQEKTLINAENTGYKYSKISKCKEELQNVKNYFYKELTKIQVDTPLQSMNIMLNGWAEYQTLVCRMWAKSAFYQSGGAFGFRDQLQDTLGLKFISPDYMKNQIIEASKHQFIEGDVEHWWHKEINKGIRTKFSDDLLWMIYVTAEYINMTGDYSILDEKTFYLEGNILEEFEDEKYDVYLEGKIEETIYMHLKRAIDKSLNFGVHGLPKIGSGDWNDGFSSIGNKGKGESIWLGFFIYDILTKFIKMCEYKKEIELIKKYEIIKENLKKVLNTEGWDGRWYKRAYMDDGDALGSIENEECKIDSIAQSFATISNAGDNDKKYISMENLENHLIDKEYGIIKLLDPPFENSKLEPGYIKAYLPGVRENGGQYTHAAIWVILAETILGFGNKAVELYKMINPIEHSRTREAAMRYKVEPYVIAADIYGAGNLIGRGGWTWYTGSSSWFYKVGIENILGFKIEKNYLTINPCIPKEWNKFQIKYRYKTSFYNIDVKNNNKNAKVQKIFVNGIEVEDKKILLEDSGKIYNVEVIL